MGGTKDSLLAREIYEEGFQIPPMSHWRPNQDFLPARRERPQERAGRRHINAMISANASGAGAARRVHGRDGLGDLEALATVIQDR